MKNLTESEISALGEELNLSDGHSYRPWSIAEERIIDDVGEIFRSVDRRDQKVIENHYFKIFLNSAGQSFIPDYFSHMLCFTASTGIEVVANLLRIRNASLALIEPCFDNLHDIVARHKIDLIAFPENLMDAASSEIEKHLNNLNADAVMLVSPNNPTGVMLNADNLLLLANFCERERKLLVLDATFRFYTPEGNIFDQYDLLAMSGVDCIIIEDTGKTWPTLEIKAPFFSVSPNLVTEVSKIYSDFLLHVSPFSVALLTRFLQLPKREGLQHIQNVISMNRREMLKVIKNTGISAHEAEFMSVGWLKLPCNQSATEFCSLLANHDVHILTGNQFFWSDPSAGDSYIRVSLSRDQKMFKRAMSIFGAIAKEQLL